MIKSTVATTGEDVSTRYEIVVAGATGPMLEAALEDFEVQPTEQGRARFVGTLPDESALHGALHRLQDLHVELLEVRRLPSS